MTTRYRITETMTQACAFLKLDPARVLRRAGLPTDWLNQTRTDVDGETVFRLWYALEAEADNPDMAFDMAQAYAHGPFVPPVLAFSSAETVFVGWQRLSVFKPLMAPMKMVVTRDADSAALELMSTLPGFNVTPGMEQFELVYLTECIRTFTGNPVTPRAIETRHRDGHDHHAGFFRVKPRVTGRTRIVLHAADADLPLITRSPSLWETLEPEFTRQLEEQTQTAAMAGRVRHILSESLPGGCTTAEEMARRLNLSKRSLQRRLTEEGTSFQALLNEVRAEMSERYLRQSDLSVPEISHLLGFRDTSSFFRAFQGWTGQTPGHFRAEAARALH